jgi:hypothetical protein
MPQFQFQFHKQMESKFWFQVQFFKTIDFCFHFENQSQLESGSY